MPGKQSPLVSIVVITYNSAKYVLETLESARAQTYKYIELVISDDCSLDDTVSLCEEWLKNNRERFVTAKIVKTKKNSGIAINCNNGVRNANGEWIKLVAGDDLVTESCISDNIDFVGLNTNCSVIASNRYLYYEKEQKKVKDHCKYIKLFSNPNITAKDQYQLALRRISLPFNTFFIKKNVFEIIHYLDERFPMLEDWPLRLRVLRNDIKIFYLNKFTAIYRVHGGSITKSLKLRYSSWFMNTYKNVRCEYFLPNVTFIERLMFRYEFIVHSFIYNTSLNKTNRFSSGINYLLLSPVRIVRTVIKKCLISKFE
ncbi:MAG: glycosyltransferase [Ferruginibacter sp.]